jgi:hypothetical protein
MHMGKTILLFGMNSTTVSKATCNSSEAICDSSILLLEASTSNSSRLAKVGKLEGRSVGSLGRRLKTSVIGSLEKRVRWRRQRQWRWRWWHI